MKGFQIAAKNVMKAFALVTLVAAGPAQAGDIEISCYNPNLNPQISSHEGGQAVSELIQANIGGNGTTLSALNVSRGNDAICDISSARGNISGVRAVFDRGDVWTQNGPDKGAVLQNVSTSYSRAGRRVQVALHMVNPSGYTGVTNFRLVIDVQDADGGGDQGGAPASAYTPPPAYPTGPATPTAAIGSPYGGMNTAANQPQQSQSGDGWIYDNNNYGQCITIQPVPHRNANKMAVGTYYLRNSCNVDLDLLFCTGQDRADGTPDNSLDLVRNQQCPRGGLGGTSVRAYGTVKGTTAWVYNRIEIGYYACKKDWDIVSTATNRTPRNLGERYRCQALRPAR